MISLNSQGIMASDVDSSPCTRLQKGERPMTKTIIMRQMDCVTTLAKRTSSVYKGRRNELDGDSAFGVFEALRRGCGPNVL